MFSLTLCLSCCIVFLMAKKPKPRGESGRHNTRRALDAVEGRRKRLPPISSPVPKTARVDLSKLPWKTIEALFCAGVPVEEIAVEYSPATVSAINKRAERGEWMSPERLRKKALALVKKSEALSKRLNIPLTTEVATVDDPVEALALKIAQGTVEHRSNILDEVGRSMKELKEGSALKIRTFADLEKADNIGRKALNLDQEDEGSKFIVNLHASSSKPSMVVDV